MDARKMDAEHPESMEAVMERFFDGVEESIAEESAGVLGVVDGKGGSPAFCYTVGATAFGLPELLLVGSADPDFAGLLQDCVEIQIRRGRAFEDQERIDIGGAFPVLASQADSLMAEEYVRQASDFFHQTVEVVQILVPDTAGRYPGDPDVDPIYKIQPILRR